MSGYVPNPDDATQPTTDKIAETAAAEFRSLKNKVNNIGSGGGSGNLSTGSGIQNMITNPSLSIAINQVVGEPIPLPDGSRNYFLDCWSEQHSLGVANPFEITGVYATTASDRPPGNVSYRRVTLKTSLGVPTAGQFAHILQGIEINNIQHLSYGSVNARPTTILITIRSSVANLLLPCSIRNSPALNRCYVFNLQLGAANVWQRLAINLPGDLVPSAAWTPTVTDGAAAFFELNLAAGSSLRTATPNQWLAGNFIASSTPASSNFTQSPVNSTLDIASIEWRPGTFTSANPFEIVPVALDVQNCYRYNYANTFYVVPGGGVNILTIPFPMFMLKNPTLVRISGAADLETVAKDNKVCLVRSVTGGFFFLQFDGQI